MSKRIFFKNSSSVDSEGNAVLPSSSTMDYGEIFINYASGVECLSIKNSNDEAVTLNFSEGDGVTAHIADTDNPHEVTAEDIGLGNISNTADSDFGVNDTLQEALDGKLDIAKIWNYIALTDGTNTYTETELSEWAFSASQGNVLNTSLNAFINQDLSDIESRIEALEAVLIAD